MLIDFQLWIERGILCCYWNEYKILQSKSIHIYNIVIIKLKFAHDFHPTIRQNIDASLKSRRS